MRKTKGVITISLFKKKHKKILKKIAVLDILKKDNATNFVFKISEQITKKKNHKIFEHELFFKLPINVRDIILVFEFEKQILIQGFPSYIENQSGSLFNETVEAFGRIGLKNDFDLLKEIQKTLEVHKLSHEVLKKSNDLEYKKSNPYLKEGNLINAFEKTSVYEEELSFYEHSGYITLNTIRFVEANKDKIINEMEEFMKRT